MLLVFKVRSTARAWSIRALLLLSTICKVERGGPEELEMNTTSLSPSPSLSYPLTAMMAHRDNVHDGQTRKQSAMAWAWARYARGRGECRAGLVR